MDLLRGNTTKRPGLRLDSFDDALEVRPILAQGTVISARI